MDLDSAKKRLGAAAEAFAADRTSGPNWASLCNAAIDFAEAVKPKKDDAWKQPGKPAAKASGYLILGGRNKGAPIEEASDKDLEFWIGRFEQTLDDPDKARFRDKNIIQLAAYKAELARR